MKSLTTQYRSNISMYKGVFADAMTTYDWYFTQRKFEIAGQWNTVLLAGKRIICNVLDEEKRHQ